MLADYPHPDHLRTRQIRGTNDASVVDFRAMRSLNTRTERITSESCQQENS
jgi:hypothetical protein